MKRNCIHCHFFSKSYPEENTGRELVFSLNKEERDSLSKDPDSFDRGWYSLKCQMGVWDEGVSPVEATEDKVLLTQNRKYNCFFLPYRKSMLFKAAIELQKRGEENRQLKTSYKMTIIGLWLAATALVVNAIIAISSAPKC